MTYDIKQNQIILTNKVKNPFFNLQEWYMKITELLGPEVVKNQIIETVIYDMALNYNACLTIDNVKKRLNALERYYGDYLTNHEEIIKKMQEMLKNEILELNEKTGFYNLKGVE